MMYSLLDLETHLEASSETLPGNHTPVKAVPHGNVSNDSKNISPVEAAKFTTCAIILNYLGQISAGLVVLFDGHMVPDTCELSELKLKEKVNC